MGVRGMSLDSREEEDPDRSRGGATKVCDPRDATRRCRLGVHWLGVRAGVGGVIGRVGEEVEATGESKVYWERKGWKFSTISSSVMARS